MKFGRPILIVTAFINICVAGASLFLLAKKFPGTLDNIIDYSDVSKDGITYADAESFVILGRLPGVSNYTRLPDAAKKKVRAELWNISENSAGLAVRFATNASAIKIRWSLKHNSQASNMTPIASKGFDLYALKDNKWQFVGVAKPNGTRENEAEIISGMEPSEREYLLYYPLYDQVTQVQIGVNKNAVIKKPKNRPIKLKNPIVFYGTSITQGASVSRPGLTYAARINRKFSQSVINLGFSGNGHFEPELVEYILSAKPSVVILDCTPNSDAEKIRNNLPKTIDLIRSIDTKVPIVLVESIIRDFAQFKKQDVNTFGSLPFIQEQNRQLKNVYLEKSAIYRNISYIPTESLMGDDNEATIDGTHPNDIGHLRIFEAIEIELNRILK